MRLSGDWRVKKHYRVLLFDLIQQSLFGRKRMPIVYTIFSSDGVLYVGQTSSGIAHRIKQHLSQSSLVGDFICAYSEKYDDLYCRISIIGGNLDNAERYYIRMLNPVLNDVLYKDSKIISPESDADEDFVDLFVSINEWEKRYNPISKRRLGYLDNNTDSDLEKMLNGAKETADLSGLYGRAYRDPNHPDFRS